jgi:hypothetical protein
MVKKRRLLGRLFWFKVCYYISGTDAIPLPNSPYEIIRVLNSRYIRD